MSLTGKTADVLTMCRKANMLVMGFDAVMEAAAGGKLSCVFTAKDISPKTAKEAKFFCEKYNTELEALCISSDEIHFSLGKKAVVLGVKSGGFARKLKEINGKTA